MLAPPACSALRRRCDPRRRRRGASRRAIVLMGVSSVAGSRKPRSHGRSLDGDGSPGHGIRLRSVAKLTRGANCACARNSPRIREGSPRYAASSHAPPPVDARCSPPCHWVPAPILVPNRSARDRKSRAIASLADLTKNPLFTRDFGPVREVWSHDENRGVPGSSPGLAIGNGTSTDALVAGSSRFEPCITRSVSCALRGNSPAASR